VILAAILLERKANPYLEYESISVKVLPPPKWKRSYVFNLPPRSQLVSLRNDVEL
jgi:hypothetical protein